MSLDKLWKKPADTPLRSPLPGRLPGTTLLGLAQVWICRRQHRHGHFTRAQLSDAQKKACSRIFWAVKRSSASEGSHWFGLWVALNAGVVQILKFPTLWRLSISSLQDAHRWRKRDEKWASYSNYTPNITAKTHFFTQLFLIELEDVYCILFLVEKRSHTLTLFSTALWNTQSVTGDEHFLLLVHFWGLNPKLLRWRKPSCSGWAPSLTFINFLLSV